MTDSLRDPILGDCWNRAIECFGTAWILQQRANRLRLKLNILAFVGFFIPLTIGILVGIFHRDAISAPLLIGTGTLAGLQAIFSLWALVAGWASQQSTAAEGMSTNYRFPDRYRDLARTPPADDAELDQQFHLIDAEEQGFSIIDMRQGITEAERRGGMRAGLRQFNRECSNCKQAPHSMTATNCDVCGNFSNSWLRLSGRRLL